MADIRAKLNVGDFTHDHRRVVAVDEGIPVISKKVYTEEEIGALGGKVLKKPDSTTKVKKPKSVVKKKPEPKKRTRKPPKKKPGPKPKTPPGEKFPSKTKRRTCLCGCGTPVHLYFARGHVARIMKILESNPKTFAKKTADIAKAVERIQAEQATRKKYRRRASTAKK